MRLSTVITATMLVFGLCVLGARTTDAQVIDDSDPYWETAIVLGDWLTQHLYDLEGYQLQTYADPWEYPASSAGVSMDAARWLKRLSNLTGNRTYERVAEHVIEFWLENGQFGNEDPDYYRPEEDWGWAYQEGYPNSWGGTSWYWPLVPSDVQWAPNAFDKLVGAFSIEFWPVHFADTYTDPTDDGHNVRTAALALCSSVARPLAAMVEFGDTFQNAIEITESWLAFDGQDRMPVAGCPDCRAYVNGMTAVIDEGMLDMAYQYWGSVQINAGQNARLLGSLLRMDSDEMTLRARYILNWFVDVMWTGESFYAFYYPTTGDVAVSYWNDDCNNGRIAGALLEAYEILGDDIYLDRALQALDYIIDTYAHTMVTDTGEVQVYFNNAWGIYNNHIIVASLAKAYEVTQDPYYLDYALWGANWIIAQIETPWFWSSYDAHAWTVAEALEALVSVVEAQSQP